MANALSRFFAVVICILIIGVELVAKPLETCDKITLNNINTYTNEFVGDCRSSGILSKEHCDTFLQNLDNTGNKYKLTIEYKHNMPYYSATENSKWVMAYDTYSENQILPLVYGGIDYSKDVPCDYSKDVPCDYVKNQLINKYSTLANAQGTNEKYKKCDFYMHQGDSIKVTVTNLSVTSAMTLKGFIGINGGITQAGSIYAQYGGVIMNEAY